ncbi:MAG: hypothetical protein JNK82_14750 [Myxococcaceae bacterium]|nr:hypothetical protein [Myxococcaceae bacterium]
MPADSHWSTWAKWNRDVQHSLADAQVAHAGDDSVDEARAKQTAQSVLDVHQLGAKKGAGTCWVLSGDELHTHFGSKNPSKKAIEAGAASFVAKLKSREAVAVTAYHHAQPVAVLFAGSTK